MPVAALFYLTSLLELCYLLRNIKFKDLQQRLQTNYRKFCASHLILIQKFDISVLDIHKEWKDQIPSDHKESDHADTAVHTNVKSVKWSDSWLDPSPISTLTHLAPQRYIKRESVPVSFGNNENSIIKLDRKLYFWIHFFS